MLRLIVCAVGLIAYLGFTVSTYAAGSDAASFGLTATVGGLCTIPNPTVGGGVTNATFSGSVINFDDAVNAVDGSIDFARIVLRFRPVTCTDAVSLSVQSANGAMTNPAATGAPGFQSIIDYIATVRWQGLRARLRTNTNPAATGPETAVDGPNTGPRSGNARLRIVIRDGTLPLESGLYEDLLTIQFGAAL